MFFFTCEFLIPQCRIFRSSRLLVIKKASWKISQHSEKNTCAGVSLLKKRLWRRCFPVNFAKFFKIAFAQNIFGWLLLSFSEIWTSAHISCSHFFRCQPTHTYLPKTLLLSDNAVKAEFKQKTTTAKNCWISCNSIVFTKSLF